MAETVLYQDSAVTVTNARVVFGGTTYALANITSVRSYGIARPLGLFILPIMVFAMGLVFFSAEWQTVGATFIGIGAAIFAGFVYLVKPSFAVRIGTSGSEVDAIVSKDFAWVDTVVRAINEAIIARA